MRENDRFAEPIITPAVKADEGHDEDISRDDIFNKNLVPEEIYLQMEDYTRKLFQRGTEMAAAQGLILVDTKYEFGLLDGKVILMDEIHTPDSSRYFYSDGYEARQSKGEPQQQLSKEFVRQWLIEQGFQGLEGQIMPIMDDAMVNRVSQRYIGLYEQLTGQKFQAGEYDQLQQRIQRAVDRFLLIP
jgi:phosphoribosylaminoimidazole-succinocarboxamide synthase